jgi:hypothetical protein
MLTQRSRQNLRERRLFQNNSWTKWEAVQLTDELEAKLLELFPMDTYVHTHSPKFPLGRVSQQVGIAYLLTWDYQY